MVSFGDRCVRWRVWCFLSGARAGPSLALIQRPPPTPGAVQGVRFRPLGRCPQSIRCGHRGEKVTSASLTLAQETRETADVSKITIAAALLISSTLVGCQSGVARDCLSGKREALVAGGFSGLLQCSGENVTLNFVGTTGSGYAVSDYRYRVMSAAVMHGGQRIVIFNGTAYVGQYPLSPPPYSTASVRASEVHVRTDQPSSEDAALDFSNGAPSQAFLDGQVVDLYR